MAEWISVKDKLPDNNDRVLAYRRNESPLSAYRFTIMWGWAVRASLRHRGITHWMPLPQPHGRWVKANDDTCWWYECSRCGRRPSHDLYGYDDLTGYCPNCGARMDGGEDDG